MTDVREELLSCYEASSYSGDRRFIIRNYPTIGFDHVDLTVEFGDSEDDPLAVELGDGLLIDHMFKL